MTAVRSPSGLGAGGRALWRAVLKDHTLDIPQRVQLEEACRCKDRLDKLDELLRGNIDTWARLVIDINSDGDVYELRMTQALTQANATANMMKQLLAAIRLPDTATGAKPQQRGTPRGSYKPRTGTSGTVSSLDRARARAQG